MCCGNSILQKGLPFFYLHKIFYTLLSENAPAGWFEILTERNTLFLKELIKSNWQKSKEN